MSETGYIRIITLDAESIPTRRQQAEHELSVAIQDLVAENAFQPENLPEGMGQGPYAVHLSVEEKRLAFDISDDAGERHKISLSIQPLKTLIRDYFLVCESYYEALSAANPSRLEAIDMGRRGLHNEGAEKLGELLDGKIRLDFATARRLFTLICVLHMK